jgi:hypothetical protein
MERKGFNMDDENDDPFRQQVEEDAVRQRMDAQRAEADQLLADDPGYLAWIESQRGIDHEISSEGRFRFQDSPRR